MTRTLVRFTLFAVFNGSQAEAHVAELGDQLAELVRVQDDTLSVSSEYDSVEADVPDEQLEDMPLLERFHARPSPRRRRHKH